MTQNNTGRARGFVPQNSGFEFSAKNWLVLLSVFLTSLGSFYFYSVGLYVFQLIGLVLAIGLCRRWPFPVASTSFSVLLVFFLLAYLYDLVLLILGINLITGGRIFLPILFFLCYWFLGAISQSPTKFVHAIKIVIGIHCVFFLIQFLYFFATGYFIDFLEPFTGESQRALGGNYEVSALSNFVRATGLYNEPGTYSTYMMLLLVFMRDLEQITAIKPAGRFVEIIVLLTVMLSFSNFGIVFVGLYLFFEFVVKSKNGQKNGAFFSRALVNSLLGVAVVFCGAIFYEYFQQRFFLSNEDGGVEFRIFGLVNVLLNVNWLELTLGRGFSAPSELYDGAPLPIQDIGFWFSVLYYVGVIGTLVLGWCLASSFTVTWKGIRANSYFCCLIFFVLLCKLGFTNPIILVLLIYATLRGAILKKTMVRD